MGGNVDTIYENDHAIKPEEGSLMQNILFGIAVTCIGFGFAEAGIASGISPSEVVGIIKSVITVV